MSVSAVIDSIAGRFVRSNAGSVRLGYPAAGADASRGVLVRSARRHAHRPRAALGSSTCCRSCLVRRLRACGATSASGNFRDRSSRPILRRRRAPRQRLRIGAIALALDERLLDVVLGDERLDHRAHRFRHRHRLDQMVAVLGEAFAFGGIGGDGDEIVRAARPRSDAAPPTAPARRLRDCRDSARSRCGRARHRPRRHRTSRRRRRRTTASRAPPPARPAAPSPARQVKSIHGLAALRRSTTTPTEICVSGATLTTRPPDAGSAGR